jgi:hypothetical protein
MKCSVNNFFAALSLRVAWIILVSLSSQTVFAQSSFLQIEGLRSNHQGLARWNADGTGSEPAATGHTMINRWPATYYFSTVDYDSINPQATSGFSFTGTATGFSNFINALSTNGFSFSDVTVKFGLYDLGNDIQDEDWWVIGNTEKWILRSQQDVLIQVNGEDMIGAPATTLRTALDFGIFGWSVESDTFFVEDRSATSSAEVQDVAAAFLMDVSSSGLKLVRPVALNTNSTSLSGNGRTGNTFDTGVWRIEMIDPPPPPPTLEIRGNVSNHQGMARWNADGSGPEPVATGHTMINGLPATYYFSTVDYGSIDPQATSGFRFTGTASGFSNFISALLGNGFSSSDVTIKFGLYDLGNDIEGEDWWVNGNIETWKLESEQDILIQVNGEDMVGAPAPTLSADLDFGTYEWLVKSDSFLVEDRSATSSAEVQDVAAAFLSDLSGNGLILVRPLAPNTNETSFNGNGRSGNTLDSGDWRIEMVEMPPPPPTLGIRGNVSNHQGMARWNADGSGPEPVVTGHTMINGLPATYYTATIDYGNIDPQSNGGFRFTGTASGFSNFISALSGNGFSSSDVTVKFGLYDLGNDIEGEDWWKTGNTETWLLKSQQDVLIQVNGEDMVGARAPTLLTVLDFGTLEWSVESDTFFVEDRSTASSTAAQAVAAAFLMDVSSSGLKLVRPMAPMTNESPFSGQGRSGTTFDTGDWRIEMVVVDTTITGIVDRTSLRLPDSFILHQNHPNPFNPSTNISYQLSKPSHVVLTIYNLLGQEINSLVNEIQAPGAISVIWDGRNEVGERVGSGVYFYQLQVNAEIQIKKMLLLQ